MHLEAGNSYRAKTANGELIAFTVLDEADGVWPIVDLDSADGPEPNVALNTRLLLWISSQRREAAMSKATEDVIEALEESTGNSV
jgi:hypothetical protein